ncbi:Cytochrome c oxidase, subunit Vb [Dillenia turbinata]|uniref:Cytochrome c oxidase, subunit Vb n=1 Tax=Dillenia turbinata TaxID=194707 RepID=A0AAN8UB83_9MAGN
MWRRLSAHLQTLARSKPCHFSTAAAANRSLISASSPAAPASSLSSILSRHFSAESDVSKPKKRVEDIMPIATGHEREELEAELEGRNILDIDDNTGPFGTKEAPAIVRSYFDKRIVGCPGGEGGIFQDEHDVVWFWLEKGKPHECPVCSQYFQLEVTGPGGPPPGYEGDDDDHHH